MKSKIKNYLFALILVLASLVIMPLGAQAAGLQVCEQPSTNPADAAALSQEQAKLGAMSPSSPQYADEQQKVQKLEAKVQGCQLYDIFRLIARLTNFLIGISGLVAIALIVWHSFAMVAQAGTDGAAKEKGHVANAIIGFIIVMFAFLAVNTILQVFVDSPYGTNFAYTLFGKNNEKK